LTRQFDVIVIGSGVGGLTAGALSSLRGRRVLVLERNQSFGGAASVYQVGDLTVEASLHELDGFDQLDPKRTMLDALGILADLRLVEVGDLYEVRSPVLEEPFVMPSGYEAAVEATSTRFPAQAGAVQEYFSGIRAARTSFYRVARRLGDRRWLLLNAPFLPIRLRPFLRYRRLSTADLFRRCFGEDERVKFAVAGHLCYYTDDPRRLSALTWIIAQASYHMGGGHYPYGGSQALTDALVARIRAAGGDAESGREVTRIILSNGRAEGVEHEHRNTEHVDRDTRRDFAPVIFGNAAPNVLAQMLPGEHRVRFMKRYADRRPSISLWQIALGFDRRPSEFGAKRYSTSVFPEWMRSLADSPQNAALLADDPAGRLPHFIFVNYTAVDTGFGAKPPFLGTVAGVDRVSNWIRLSAAEYEERTQRWIDAIIAALDRLFPGIASTVVETSMTTALSIQRYLNTPDGAVYGFERPIPAPLRLIAPATPIEGLWLASAYAGSGGYSGAMMGGAAAVGAALSD
jgi:all-trans-retinol 13,14-reductase